MDYTSMPIKSTEAELAAASGYDELILDDRTIYGTREEAASAIEKSVMLGEPSAVRYKHVALDELQPTVTMGQIEDRKRRMEEQRDKYAAEHSIHTLSAKLVTCTKCESRIAKDFVDGEFCPVCGNDLRSPYIPAQIATYEDKIADLVYQYDQARERLIKRALAKGEVEARVMWLVPVADEA